MNKLNSIALFGLLALSAPALAEKPAEAPKVCKWSDAKRLQEHLTNHIKYPTTGKAVKAACKKEWPDEFTAEERACAEAKIKDGASFKSADELLKLLDAS
jgi:hypothetical protein